ncbi:MAG: hypothetical protein JWM80_2334 [Cyanobacteria bacterium RYN_339]|nr:hypothetical protein [Cyanobacteria bacterium RYN_339]
MRAGVVGAIARKEISQTFGTRAVWGPALVAPAWQVGFLTAATWWLSSQLDPGAFPDMPRELIDRLLAPLPPDLAAQVAHQPPAPKLALLFAGQIAAPLFMLAPISLTLLLSASAFVAEKEARTLEALLYTPATDLELLTGKLVGAVLPALAMGWLAFAAYGVCITRATWGVVGYAWFPTPIWWPWMFWDLPAFLTLAAAAMVLISTRARSQTAAQQLGGLLGVLATGIVGVQAAGVARADLATAGWTGVALWLAAGLVLALARRDFSRQRLVLRL